MIESTETQSAGIGALGGLVAGGYIDIMRKIFPDAIWGKDYCYRLIPAWNLPFLLLGFFFLFRLYRTWKELGGDAHYVPPGSTLAAAEAKSGQMATKVRLEEIK